MNNHHKMAAAAVDKYADKLMSSRLSDRDQPPAGRAITIHFDLIPAPSWQQQATNTKQSSCMELAECHLTGFMF